MNRIVLLLICFSVFQCKNLYNLPEGNIQIEKLETDRYEIQYPKDWHVSNVHGHSNFNSIAIFRFKKASFKSASFSLVLDMYSTELELKDVINDIIDADYILRTASINSVEHYPAFTEIAFTYQYKLTVFKGIKRFYKKNNQVSEISFKSNEKDFEDFSKYKKLFLGTFKLK